MKIMLKYLKPFRRRMTAGISIKILGTLVELLLPYILSHILEKVVVREDIRQVIFWGLLMILCAGVA